MTKYRILSRKGSEKEGFTYLAVNYIAPSMVKISSKIKLRFNSTVYIDSDVAYYRRRYLGRVLAYKSSADITVSTDYSIKYAGGYSLDGSRVFLDKNFPKYITVRDKVVDAVESIAKHHEVVEKWMIDLGYTYAYSHRIATAVERDFLNARGVKWNDYDESVSRCLHENYGKRLENSPLDLDLLPYIESRDTKALREIKESMNTEILDIARHYR